MKVLMAMMAGLLAATPLTAADSNVYELRIYWAAEGKLDALHARFRDHTLKLFEKHGITNVGYWVPADNADSRLIYLVAHKDRDAAKASWKAFGADPDWKKAFAESEKNGKLVSKIESLYLDPTDFSPAITASDSKKERIFELRTYATTPNNLDPLQRRFRKHTTGLFEKYGMTNVAYFTLRDDKPTWAQVLPALTAKGNDAAEVKSDAIAKPNALIYFLAHASDEARKKSFDAFRADAEWITVKSESEAKAGGSLTVKDGVKSLVLKATDYSPLK